jgi:UDP-N-acetylmuramate--alanine ligase
MEHVCAVILAAGAGTVDASNLVKRINNVTDNAVYIASFKDIVNRLIQDSSPGDLILTMGAGNVDQIGNMFLQEKKIRAVG